MVEETIDNGVLQCVEGLSKFRVAVARQMDEMDRRLKKVEGLHAERIAEVQDLKELEMRQRLLHETFLRLRGDLIRANENYELAMKSMKGN